MGKGKRAAVLFFAAPFCVLIDDRGKRGDDLMGFVSRICDDRHYTAVHVRFARRGGVS